MPTVPLSAPAEPRDEPARATTARLPRTAGAAARIAWALVAIAFAVAILVGAGWRIVGSALPHAHPDEPIVVGVGRQLDWSLDTNWRHAPGLPAPFGETDQYNFSAYILFANAAFDGAAAALGLPRDDAARLAALRAISLGLGLALIGMAGWLARRLGADRFGAAAAAALVALSPSLVMDSLYARPETFVCCLSVGFCLAASAPRRRWRSALAALLCGLLVATKISFLPLLPFLLIAAAPIGRRDGGAIAAGFVLGVCLGMPQAVLHPREFIAGAAFLARFYHDAGGYPHGLGPAAPWPSRLLYGAVWTRETWGLWPPLGAGLGAAALLRERRRREALLCLPFVLTMVYFWSEPLFFERNFSPSLVVLAALFGRGVCWLRSRCETVASAPLPALVVGAAVAAALWTPALTSARVFDALAGAGSRAHRVDAQAMALATRYGAPVARLGWGALPDDCRPGQLVEVFASGGVVPRPLPPAWREVGRDKSLFENDIPSTLQAYLSRTVIWLRCAGPREGD
ncbi:MAG TPA: hypothetical protein VMB84_04240 [Stellaceae bacterium]|nr:hypothetical protein [Stellaceae bacterium]